MIVLFLICNDGPWPTAATDAVAPPLPGSLYQDTPLDPELRYEVSSFVLSNGLRAFVIAPPYAIVVMSGKFRSHIIYYNCLN